MPDGGRILDHESNATVSQKRQDRRGVSTNRIAHFSIQMIVYMREHQVE